MPLPGAQLVLWVLFVNLVAATIYRFSYKANRVGILIIHGGLFALFFGMLRIMAAAMRGAGAHSDLLRPVQPAGLAILSRVHELLAILSLGVNLIALVQTPIYIVRNNILLDEVMGDDAVRASDEVDEAPVEQAKE